jgi:DNA-binding CsgD family transcriptional regulator
VNALVEARTAAGQPPDDRDLALVARAAELLESPHLRRGSDVQHWIAYCLALHELDVQARRVSDRAIAEVRAAGDVWSLCYALYARAAIEAVTGRIDTARTWATDAVALAEDIGEPWRLSEAYAVLVEVEAARGTVEECARANEVKRANWPRDPNAEFYYRLPLGRAHLACGHVHQAVEHLERAAASFVGGAARGWYQLVPLDLAEAYAFAGRKAEAEALVRDVAGGIEASPLRRPRAMLGRVHALLASEAHLDVAFGAAREPLEGVPHLLEEARIELCWGERLCAAGRARDAVPHLEHAAARFDALGAVGWSGRTRRALELATGTTRSAEPRRTDVLTPQELRVARHAASGMRDREIAALLYLSPRTVEAYLQSAYRKLDVANRTQLAGVLAADGVRPLVESGAAQVP